MNRIIQNANRITHGRIGRFMTCAFTLLLSACTQGPGGGGIGLASGQEPDPATVDFPIFYIRHQIPLSQDNVTRVRPFVEDDDYSATLWKRDRASPGAPETEVSARLRTDAFGGEAEDRYDIKDLNVSPDGLKVIFAMRGPLDDFDEDEAPTWNIWEYAIVTDTLHRVITADILAEDGQDVAPSYLPDGRILFSSTRQRQAKAILLDEGKSQFEAANESRGESAFVLHVMNSDGTDIRQISFNPSSDLYGQVLQSGRVLFTRWDNAPGRNGLHLYTANPDGTDTQLHYGAVSHLTGTGNTNVEFMRAREMSDGRLMVLTRGRTNVDFGGNLTIIDTRRFVENTQTVIGATAAAGETAQRPATLNDVRTVPGPSPGGRFNSGFPLWDGSGRILVSWTQCRLLDVGGTDPTRIVPCDPPSRLTDPEVQAARPLYSIWMFNPAQNTILPIMPPTESVMVTEAVAAQPRVPLPAVLLPANLDPDLVAEGVGVLSIQSVYDIMGVDQGRTTNNAPASIANLANPTTTQYANRMVRFVRIEKPVSQPDDDGVADPDNSAFGASNVMREIVAYAPVEPDGSVRMKVPANVAFRISLLDANGRRVNISPSGNVHSAWLTVRPGEELACNGCHTRVSSGTDAQGNALPPLVHGRRNLFNSAWVGATATGAAFPGAVNTIFPVAGDSMARARSRLGSSCIDPAAPTVERCGPVATNPSADVVYEEVWKTTPLVTDSFAYNYSALTTPRPSNFNCVPWSATCRITIHYATIGTPPRLGHIHPLWSFVRTPPAPVDTNGDAVLEPTYTCTSCHSRVDVVNVPQLPKASLELTEEVSNADNLQLEAFRQLLFPRSELEIVGGVVRVRLVPLLDADGDPVLDDAGNPVFVPVTLQASMTAGNARGSRFFNVMNSATHTGMLTTAELRLLSEWLDIGAQYYNDPFPPTPQN